MDLDRTPVTIGVRFDATAADPPVLAPQQRRLVHRRLRELLPHAEIVVLATCQRTEVLVAGVTPSDAIVAWHAALAMPPTSTPSCLAWTSEPYVHMGVDALRHTCRVACGLDSAILGDADIAAQLRVAHREAEELGTLGPTTRRLLRAAFATAKTARATTTIASQARGASAAAAAVVRERRPGAAVVVVGTGMAAKGVLRHLRRAEHAVTVAGRDRRAADALGAELGASSAALDDPDLLAGAGALVAAIPGPSPVVEEALAARASEPGALLVVDMGMPRCVAPRRRVDLVTLADLAARRGGADVAARRAVPVVEALIDRACRTAAGLELRSAGERCQPTP